MTVHGEDVHFAGTVRIEAEIDMADAFDLDRAIAHGAATQKALGSTESLDARRAVALGDLARTQTALDLFNQGDGFEARSARTSTTEGDSDRLPTAREVVLHAHFDADHRQDEQTIFGPTGRLEERQRLLLLDQLRSWCADSRTRITDQAGHRPQHRPLDPGVQGPGPDPRANRSPRPHVRVPVVHPTRPGLRRRPRHRVRPRRRRRRPTPARPDRDVEPRRAVPVPPPPQDPLRLALRDDRARRVRLDQSPRSPLPPRPHRHHRNRPTRPGSTRHSTPAPTMTPPHTPPATSRRGHRHAGRLMDAVPLTEPDDTGDPRPDSCAVTVRPPPAASRPTPPAREGAGTGAPRVRPVRRPRPASAPACGRRTGSATR